MRRGLTTSCAPWEAGGRLGDEVSVNCDAGRQNAHATNSAARGKTCWKASSSGAEADLPSVGLGEEYHMPGPIAIAMPMSMPMHTRHENEDEASRSKYEEEEGGGNGIRHEHKDIIAHPRKNTSTFIEHRGDGEEHERVRAARRPCQCLHGRRLRHQDLPQREFSAQPCSDSDAVRRKRQDSGKTERRRGSRSMCGHVR